LKRNLKENQRLYIASISTSGPMTGFCGHGDRSSGLVKAVK